MIDGVPVPAVVDTGARDSIINWAAARSLGLSPTSPGLRQGAAVRGATAHATASMSATFAKISIGEAGFRDRDVRIADLPVFGILGFKPDQPAMILGIDLFAKSPLVVDYPGSRLFVSRERSAGRRS